MNQLFNFIGEEEEQDAYLASNEQTVQKQFIGQNDYDSSVNTPKADLFQPQPESVYSTSQLREIASDNNARFIADLEFVTLLSSPDYLFFLATSPEGYFEKPEFLNYLSYLSYMFEIGPTFPFPNPNVLYFLKIVQNPMLRENLKYHVRIHELRESLNFHWAHSRETQYRQKTIATSLKNAKLFSESLYPLDTLMENFTKNEVPDGIQEVSKEQYDDDQIAKKQRSE